MIVLVLMSPLIATALSETLNCKAGSFSLGETASVTCYFHEDVGKSLHHFYVSFSPFDSRNEVTDTDVLICYNQRGESYSCSSARGYYWDNVISSTLTIQIPEVQTRFAGHYSCHLAPLGDLQIKPCDLHVEDGNGPSLDLTAMILGAVSGIVLIALIVLAVHCHMKHLNKKGRSEQPSPEPGTEMPTLQQHAETSDPGMEMPTPQQHAETSDSGTEMPTLQQHAETSDRAKMSVFGKMVEEKLEAQMSVFGKMVEEKLERAMVETEMTIRALLEEKQSSTSWKGLEMRKPSTKKELEMLTSSTSWKGLEMRKVRRTAARKIVRPFTSSYSRVPGEDKDEIDLGLRASPKMKGASQTTLNEDGVSLDRTQRDVREAMQAVHDMPVEDTAPNQLEQENVPQMIYPYQDSASLSFKRQHAPPQAPRSGEDDDCATLTHAPPQAPRSGVRCVTASQDVDMM